MPSMKNPRSLALQNANPRLLTSPNADVLLSASTPIFHVNNSGVPSTNIITFNASLIAMEGTVAFTCEGGTLSNIVGNTCALNYETLTGDTATVKATITFRNKEYSDTVEISKLYDGQNGVVGMNNAVVYAYQRSATQPTGTPGVVQYSFPAAGITTATLANSWQKTIPSGTLPLWVTAASASASGSLDDIAANEWSSAVILAQNGIDGVSPALMSLSSTAQSFTYDGTGGALPASQTISFTANLTNTTGTATFACTKYDASGASLGTVTMGGTGNTRTLTIAQFTTAAARAVITATLGAITDTITVVRLADGAAGTGVSALAGYLTNESVTVPTASDGSGASLSGASGNFKVFQGTTDVTSGCTFAVVGTPLVTTAAPASTTGAYSVTAVGTWGNSSLTTSVTYRATHTASGATIDQVLTITKAPAGINGTSPAILNLTSTAQSITYNGTGVATPANQTISFTANLQNTTGTATFACTKYDAAGTSLGAVTLGGTGNTRTLTDAQFTTSAFRAVVTATLGGLSDTITIVRLADGAAGSGVSALAGYLTNESVNVPTANDGSGAVLTGVNGNFKVFQGTTDVTADCTFSVVGTPLVTTTAPTAATGAYSVTGVGTWANSSLTTSVTYRALHTPSGATIDQVLTLTKAPAGAQGNNGINSATITVYRRTTTTTAPALPSAATTYTFSPPGLAGLNNSWTTTIPAASNGAYLWATTATAASATPTDTIAASEWAAAQMLVQDGGKGDTGSRGNVQVARAIPGSVWSDSEAALAISGAGYGVPQNRDIVTLYNNSASYSQQKYYDGAAWQALAAYFPGGVIVDGTVDATALKAKTITGDKIAAGAITANSLLVTGDQNNLVRDPKFRDMDWWGFTGSALQGLTYGRWEEAGQNTRWKHGTSLYMGPTITSNELVTTYTKTMPLISGATYLIQYQVGFSGDFNGDLTVWLHTYQWMANTLGGLGLVLDSPYKFNGNGDPIQYPSSSRGGVDVSHVITIPNNTAITGCQFIIKRQVRAGTCEIGGFTITRVMDNVLIKDGAVTAAKVQAGSIGTNQLSISQGGAINSGQTGFDQGDGFWIEGAGNGHGARMSLGNSSGPKIIADPANGILRLVNPQFTTAMSVNVADAILLQRTNGTTVDFNMTYTVSSGVAPYRKLYSLSVQDGAPLSIISDPTLDTITIRSKPGQNISYWAYLSLTLTDANNAVATSTALIRVQYGDGSLE